MGATRSHRWNPLSGITWTADTEVEKMRKIVRNRESTFERQRTYRSDTDLQRRAASILQHRASQDGVFKSQLDRYFEFCQTLDVPPFPLTSTMIALAIFAKTSRLNGHYSSTHMYLKRARKEVCHLWSMSTAEQVRDDEAEWATSDFLKERSDIRMRSRQSKRNTVAKLSSGSEEASSTSDSDSGSASESESPVQPRPASTASRTFVQLPTPGLPLDGQRFRTIEKLMVACYVALIPVYGMGCHHNGSSTVRCARAHDQYSSSPEGKCPWAMVATVVDTVKKGKKVRRLVVDHGSSHLSHNHGPRPELVSNPQWRPLVKNLEARRLLGMDGTQPSKDTSQLKRPEPADPPRQSQPSSIDHTFKKPRLASSSSGPRATAFSSPNSAPVPSSSRQEPAPQQVSGRSHPSPSFSTPIPTPSLLPSSLSGSTPVPITVPELAAFFSALHPSLSALAVPFYAAGIDTFDSLSSLSAFAPGTIERFCRSLKEKDVGNTISSIHLALFKKKLKEAGDGGYAC